MPALEDRCVLVIHGTWNPRTPTPQWHQLDASDPENFCRRLNEELDTEHHLGHPVWRTLGGDPTEFGWTGENDHAARVEAAAALQAYLRQIRDKHPGTLIDLVGHSHGCNVVLKALEGFLAEIHHEARLIVRKSLAVIGQERAPAEAARIAAREVLGAAASAMDEGIRPAMAVLEAELNVIAEKAAAKSGEARKQYLHDLREKQQPAEDIAGKFVRVWFNATPANPLGRIVLMGAPFFYKYWPRRRWRSVSTVTEFANRLLTGVFFAVTSAIAIFAMMYATNVGYELLKWVLTIAGINTASSAPIGDLYRPVTYNLFNPLNWSAFQFYSSVVPALLAIPVGLLAPILGFTRWRYDTNVYFDTRREPRIRTETSNECAVRLDTLVVSAGPLDEAALGFSTEPILYGFLLPEVRSLLYRPLFNYRQAEIGLEQFVRPIQFGWAAAGYGVRAVATIGLRLVRWLSPLDRSWTRLLLGIVASPAFGLRDVEFDDALILASEKLTQPEVFRATHWNVEQILLAAPAPAVKAAARPEQRYAFLWDEQARETLKGKSEFSKAVAKRIDEVKARASAFPQVKAEDIEAKLTTTALVLEQRFKEAVGLIPLHHSAYYSNDVVIKGIARFIATGRHI